MANKFIISIIAITFFLGNPTRAQTAKGSLSLNNSIPSEQLTEAKTPKESQGKWYKYQNTPNGKGLIWEGKELNPIVASKFFTAVVYNPNPYIIGLDWGFYKGKQPADTIPDLNIKIRILPYLETQIVLPLSALENKEVFLPRFPRQLKSMVEGKAIALKEVKRISLCTWPKEVEGAFTQVLINKIEIWDKTPPALKPLNTKPIVDTLGQWTAKDWQGKSKSVDEANLRIEKSIARSLNAQFPDAMDEYGGDKSVTLESTGFFRVQFYNGRWWMVTPSGHPFLSTGINSIRPSSPAPYNYHPELFTWLPKPDKQTVFKDALSENLERGQKLIDYPKANLIRALGPNWQEKWISSTSGQMKRWGFNTIGNWSSPDFIKGSRMPYVLPLKDFPSTKIKLFRDFPDVYSQEYLVNVMAFAAQLQPYKEDRLLIGYFLGNEPEWSFGANNLALEVLKSQVNSETKNALIQYLKSNFKTIEAFNKAMGSQLTRMDEISSWKPNQNLLKPEGLQLLNKFNLVLMEKYLAPVCSATKSAAPNHLNLGIRYPWISSDLCYAAAKFFDVFSLNGYSAPVPPQTSEITKRTGKPVIIGEFHFGALDRGLPATGICAANNQTERAAACKFYMEAGFARPEIVGIHYFQYLDQPITGRFDGENYQIGLVDVCFNPYMEVIEAFRSVNREIYSIAKSKGKILMPEITKVTPVY